MAFFRKNSGEPRKPTPTWWKWTKRITVGLLCIAMVLGIVGVIMFMTIMNSVESRVDQLPALVEALRKEPTKILSADEPPRVLYTMSAEYREPVSWPDIPKTVIDSTICAEDTRFYGHRGVDHIAVIRALWTNMRSGAIRQGGSTITQQVAKRLLTSGERSWKRKLEDACLALQIEKRYSKEQILTIYLNQIFYGSGAYGIKAAALTYFGKTLDKLTIAEAALLSRCPRRPNDENPFVDPNAAEKNRNNVLAIMLEEGKITQDQYKQAVAEPVKLVKKAPASSGFRYAPYFVTYVLDQLRKEFPDEDYARGGYTIYTTLRMDAQSYAEKALQETIRRYRYRKVTEGAIMVMDLKGQVIAMVGGLDFKRSQFNAVTQGSRQPGSAFKPFIYSAALEMGRIDPNSYISNDPFIYKDPSTGRVWRPKGGGKGGSVSVMSAISRSINVPAVRVCEMVGPGVAAKFAQDQFGFKSKLYPALPLALGSSDVKPIEMAEAYSVFANGGTRVMPYGIIRVVNHEGQALLEDRSHMAPNVISAATAEAMDSFLRAVVTRGTGTAASEVLNARGKTGTTNDYKDAWFCGYTDDLVCITWVSNATYDAKRTPPYRYGSMDGVFGGEVCARMFARALRPIQQLIGEKQNDKKYKRFDGGSTSGKVSVLICEDSGERAIPGKCPHVKRELLPSDEAAQLGRCSFHESGLPDASPDTIGPDDGTKTTDAPPPNNDPPPATVVVEICVETGMLGSAYCPVKRIVSFPKGQEPTSVCTKHKPGQHSH
ncbi:MAG: PBP1A family penicillin-binding protein [Fimbriimonadales bacterium]